MLAGAGHEVHFIVRSDYDVLSREGLRLSTDGGEFRLSRIHVHRSPETVPACDVVLSCLKMTQLEGLSAYLPRIVADGGVVVALQNGLGAEDVLAQLLPPPRVWGAICFLCATRPEPGQVHQADTNGIRIAPLLAGHTSELISTLVAELLEAGVDAAEEADLAYIRWRKLAWNIPYNGLCALLRRSTSEINAQSAMRALVRELMEEVRAGCLSVTGRELPAELPDQLLSMTDRFDHYRPSMLLDVLGGRGPEVEAILLEPARRAAHAGRPMLRTEMLGKLLWASYSALE
jgi:2-dehydropantoate 2-reductase